MAGGVSGGASLTTDIPGNGGRLPSGGNGGLTEGRGVPDNGCAREAESSGFIILTV